MVPQEADQLTGTLAENCWVPMACMAAAAGVMVMGEVMVATVVLVCPPVLVAVIVQVPFVSGAV